MTNDQELLSASFNRDGVVLLKNILSHRVPDLVQALSYAVENPSPMSSVRRDESGSQVFFTDFFTYRKNPSIRSLITDSKLVAEVSTVVGSANLKLFHDHVLIKSGMAPETPWHQDRPYYLVDGPISCSVWLTADHVPLDESLNFIRGSHLTGDEYAPVGFKDGEILGDSDLFKRLDEEKLRELQSLGVLAFSMEPGDGLLFDNRIVHRAVRSNRQASRRALSVRYLGDGAHLTLKYVNATPPFDKLGLRVIDGGDLPEVWFPTVYGKA